MKRNEMPIGFGMTLAMNPDAMEKFASLPQSEKQKVINGTHSISSKAEMKQYVENIVFGVDTVNCKGPEF